MISALQRYGEMLPDQKFQQLDGAAVIKRVSSEIGVILEKKIRALQVSVIAAAVVEIIVH